MLRSAQRVDTYRQIDYQGQSSNNEDTQQVAQLKGELSKVQPMPSRSSSTLSCNKAGPSSKLSEIPGIVRSQSLSSLDSNDSYEPQLWIKRKVEE